MYVSAEGYSSFHDNYDMDGKQLNITMYENGTIQGHVINRQTKELITDANVLLEVTDRSSLPLVAQTNEDGYFEVEDVYEGQYQIRAHKEGYAHTDGPVVAVQSGKVTQNVVIALEAEKLFHGVALNESGEPVSGVNIHLPAMPLSFDTYKDYSLDNIKAQELAVSQENGVFTVQGIQSTGDTILLVHPDYVSTFFTIAPTQLSKQAVPVTMHTGGTVRGSVFQQDGQALSRVLLYLKWSPAKPYTDFVRSDGDGSFVFKHIPAGEYEVLTFMPNATKEPVSKPVSVRNHEESTVEFLH
jgi:hypothetical protein